jgi:oxalate decarboxylase
MFKSSYYRDVSLTNWLTHVPPELVIDHLKITQETLDKFPHDEPIVMP